MTEKKICIVCLKPTKQCDCNKKYEQHEDQVGRRNNHDR